MWYDRLEELRQQAEHTPHHAGEEGLRLLEDWLYEQAKANGYRKPHASMREYLGFVAKGNLSNEERARIERYTEVRNCLSHRSGLQMTASLTAEILDFMGRLFRRDAINAHDLMTPRPHTVQSQDNLRQARDWMLENGVSRLPVVDGRGRIVGLLTNRDLLTAAANALDGGNPDTLTVGDAMSNDSEEKVAWVSRYATYETVLTQLKNPAIAAIFVTEKGEPNQALLGIISVTDLLPKL